MVKGRGGTSKYPHFLFKELRIVSAIELARKTELLHFAVLWEEMECIKENFGFARDITSDGAFAHPEIEQVVCGFAGQRIVLAIKVKRRRMESLFAAALVGFEVAKDCSNVAKISFVAGPFGTGTISILAPNRSDIVVYDKFESEDDQIKKTRDGFPNMRLIDCSFRLVNEGNQQQFIIQLIPLVTGRPRIETADELPTHDAMYDREAHGLLEALYAMEKFRSSFSVIGLIVDNLNKIYVRNESQEASKNILKMFLKKAFQEDALLQCLGFLVKMK